MSDVATPDRFTSRLSGIDRTRRSPNHGPRLGYHAPDSLVLHYTGMADGASAIARLCDPVSQVSCHYVVTETGDILQLVDEDRRAWCCGRSFWQGLTDLNSASVNIEIVNGGHDFGLPAFPDPQIAAVIELSRDIVARHGIAPARVLAHSDIAPGRKRDPGERFPWARLARAGLGLWPSETTLAPEDAVAFGQEGPAVRRLQEKLARLGYGLEVDGVYGPETRIVVEAFQRRFRAEQVDGIADGQTLGHLHALLTSSHASA